MTAQEQIKAFNQKCRDARKESVDSKKVLSPSIDKKVEVQNVMHIAHMNMVTASFGVM